MRSPFWILAPSTSVSSAAHCGSTRTQGATPAKRCYRDVRERQPKILEAQNYAIFSNAGVPCRTMRSFRLWRVEIPRVPSTKVPCLP